MIRGSTLLRRNINDANTLFSTSPCPKFLAFFFFFLLGTELPLKVPSGGGGGGELNQTQRRHLSSFKPVSILGNGELSPLKSPGRVATEDRRRLEERGRGTKCAERW